MKKEQITITGSNVYAIERANRASFYGIYGNKPDCDQAMRLCCEAVENHLTNAGMDWNWFEIISADVVSTNGRSPSATIAYRLA